VFLFGFKSTRRNKKRFAPRTNHASVAAINDNYCGVARRSLRHYVRAAMLAQVEKFFSSMSGSHPSVRPLHAAIEKPRGSQPMSKISPCLWFDGEAEEAAKFYVALLPDSRIEHVQKNTVDSPAGKAGSVLVVEFTLAGQRFMALNGGKAFDFSHAISFKIDCADQAEVDRYWDALSEGGSVEQCGWLKDRYGVSWQIVPTALVKYLGGPDRAGAQRAMQAMMGMIKLDIAGLKQAYEGKPAA
jgi:predicted 3-demethylubiquinone-9 3-methyltransferase (glyoxalase superfamily)